MADYGKLLSRIWSDTEFRALTAREQQLYFLLLSFPTRNLAGVLPLTLKRWTNCTSDATEKKIIDALQRLHAVRFIIVDWDTEEVLIRTYIRNDEVYRQPNLMKAALKDAQKTESTALRQVLRDELLALPEHRDQQSTATVADALVKTPSEGFAMGSTSPQDPQGQPSGGSIVPLFEPHGVGGYLSNPLDAPTPTPAPTPAPVTPSKRGTRLPQGWEPPDDVKREMHAQFPHVDLRTQHEVFSDYWHGKAGKDAVKVDWVATWRNWIRRAATETPTRNGTKLATSDLRVIQGEALKAQIRSHDTGKELPRGR